LCEEAVSITNTSWAAFNKHTDETIRATVRRLENHHAQYMAGNMTKDMFELRSTMLGWNWTPNNVILNEKFRLRVASCVMYDWAHVYVNDGLADTELGQCMKVLHSSRAASTYQELGEYVSTFSFPRAAGELQHLFTASANTNNYKKASFTSTGSEFLTLTPVLHRYFAKVAAARDECMPFVQSMMAVLTVVMMLQSVKTGTVGADELFAAIVTHLTLYQIAYGDDATRPKHHYALHLPDMLRRFGFLLSTFTHERKHRIVKRYTRDRKTLKNWALGAIEDITCHQIWENSLPFFLAFSTSHPKGKMFYALRELFPGVADEAFTLHNHLKCNGGQASAGDVVSCLVEGKIEIGELLMTVGVVEGSVATLWSILSLWKPRHTDEVAWATYWVDDHVVKVHTKNIDTVCTYRMCDDRQSCAVHLPYELRPR